jgi:hypothetical protein
MLLLLLVVDPAASMMTLTCHSSMTLNKTGSS